MSVSGLVKHIVRIFMTTVVFLTFSLCVNAESDIEKYEIYNKGELVDITPMVKFSNKNGIIKPILYINIKDIYKLGLIVQNVENGVCISDNRPEVTVCEKAYVYFDGSPIIFGRYVFEDALEIIGDKKFLYLDVLGKGFSGKYYSEAAGAAWKTYLDIDTVNTEDMVGSITLDSTVLDFEHDVCSLMIENKSYYGFDDVKIYMAYYDRNGKLLNADIKRIYTVEPQETVTVLVDVNDCFDKAKSIKLMLWDGNGRPLIDTISLRTSKKIAYEIPPLGEREELFTDIKEDSKYFEAVYIMNKNFGDVGIFNGYEDGTYRPEAYVTRAEAAYTLTMLSSTDLKNAEINYSFADMTSSHWCKKYAAYMAAKGFMPDVNGYFYPNENITWEELISAFLKMPGEQDFKNDELEELAKKYNLSDNIERKSPITRGDFTNAAYNFIKEYESVK